MRAITYLEWLGGVVAALAASVLILTVAVDPYRMFDTPTVSEWTELKPRAYQQAGLAKTYQLERVTAKTLILGNSRVEIGLDPLSHTWPSDQRPVFNGAMAGGNMFTSLVILREAVAVRVLRGPRAH